MSSENSPSPPEAEKVTLRGIQSVTSAQMSVGIENSGTRWPIVLGNIPRRAENFRQRPQYLIPRRRHPKHESNVVITGLGGVGKTQLAVAFVAELVEMREIDFVLWISATSRDAVLLMYRQAARRVLNVGADSELPANWLDELFGWFQSTRRRWLVVLDGVREPADLVGMLPPGPAGQTLVTTRHANLVEDPSWRRIRLGVYSAEESIAYLEERLDGRPGALDGAYELANALAHLPLALAQAASSIIDSDSTCSRYLSQQLRPEYERLRNGTLPAISPDSDLLVLSATTWSALDAVRRKRHGLASLELLQLSALLDPTGFPRDVLNSIAVRSFIARRTSSRLDEAVIAEATDILVGLGLMFREASEGLALLRVPGPVRSIVLQASGDTGRSASATADALLEVWPSDDYSMARSDFTQLLLLSLDELRRTSTEALWRHDEMHPVLIQAGQTRLALGLIEEAVTYWRDLVDEATERLGQRNLGTLRAMANLGRACQYAGRFGEALPLLLLTVENSRQLLGEDDPETLASYNNLATCYRSLGRLGEAIEILERTLRVRQEELGRVDPTTLTSATNLAAAYREVGRTSDAVDLLALASAEQERVLGSDDPDTIVAKHNLALAYLKQPDITKGLDLLETVSTEAGRVLGDSHPRTLATRSSLGAAYLTAGRVQDAVDTLRAALEGCEANLGFMHPDTLAVRNNLGRAYQALGALSDAIDLLQFNADACLESLGANHPDTLISQSNLAVAYRAAGRRADALVLLRAVLDQRERILGENHPDTVDSRGRLASALIELGQPEESLALQESVLEQQTLLVGPHHPDTLNTRNSLALTYRLLGDLERAADLFETNLAERRQALGATHPATLEAQNNLAIVYWDVGRLQEALALFKDAVGACVSVLGPSHPSTMATRANLALAAMESGDSSLAIRLLETNMTYSEQLYGPADRTTLSMASNLANAYKSAGRLADAGGLLESSHAIASDVLGPSDPTTTALSSNLDLVRGAQETAD